MVVPKPLEVRHDPNEIERWIARLARAIRLRRLEQGFSRCARLGGTDQRRRKPLNPVEAGIVSVRR